MNDNYTFVDELDFDFIKKNLRRDWVDLLINFLESDKKYCIISCGTEEEQKRCLGGIRGVVRRNNLDITFGRYKSNSVYLAKG